MTDSTLRRLALWALLAAAAAGCSGGPVRPAAEKPKATAPATVRKTADQAGRPETKPSRQAEKPQQQSARQAAAEQTGPAAKPDAAEAFRRAERLYRRSKPEKADAAVSAAGLSAGPEAWESLGFTALRTGEALTLRGRTDDGRTALAAARRYFKSAGSRFGVYASRTLAACSYLPENRFDQAAEDLARIWKPLHSLRLEEILWHARGRYAEAFDRYSRSVLRQSEEADLDRPPAGPPTAEQAAFIRRLADSAEGLLSSIALTAGKGAAEEVEKEIFGLRRAASRKAAAEAAERLGGRIRQIAYDGYRKAIGRLESARSVLGPEKEKRAFGTDKQHLYEGYIRLAVELHGARAGLVAVERAKGRAFFDLLDGRNIDFREHSAADAEIRVRRRSAQLLAEAIAAGSSRSAIAPALDRYRRATEKLREQSPELASIIAPTPPVFNRIAGVVPRPGALLEYYAASDMLYLFAVRSGKVHVRLSPVGAGELARRIAGFREAITRRRKTDEPAKRLYALLFRPVEDLLSEKRLVVVPDGPLYSLPFGAIGDGTLRLCQRFSLSFSPSAQALAFARTKFVPRKGTVLAFGAPDPEGHGPGSPADTEALQVAELYPGSSALVGARATETAAKRLSPDSSILHFAGPGEIKGSLDSALLLAADGSNDGRLKAAEIFSLDLAADVVTLSRCGRKPGPMTRGAEGVALNRAFLYAGAPRVLSSLWRVKGESTRQMMLDFYRNLQLMPADRALQEAQNKLIRSERFRSPYYWAGFYLTGDWR